MSLTTAIGLMSGTSMDGIDLALIHTDGRAAVELGPSLAIDYSAEERDLLRRAVADATRMTKRDQRPGSLADAETLLTRRHAALVHEFLAGEGLGRDTIDVIGFHGQTVLHRPERRLTVQLGDGAALAAETGIAVVYDLRAADVAAGGQGAPFVPVFHKALVEASALPGPVVVLNLGGVGNLTYVERGRDPIAFDTGPANALIDDLVLERLALPMDRDGAIALSGHVDEAALARLMDNPYFHAPPPKSLDRNAFSRDAVANLTVSDAAATLAAFTVATVKAAGQLLPREPARWVVCGGGARNGAIMRGLADSLPGDVSTADAIGWSAAMMEAQAFAYLAVRSLQGLPLSFPTTTGVPRPMTGGILVRPSPVGAHP